MYPLMETMIRSREGRNAATHTNKRECSQKVPQLEENPPKEVFLQLNDLVKLKPQARNLQHKLCPHEKLKM